MTAGAWATAWVVMVGTRVVAVVPDVDAAVGMANELGGAVCPFRRDKQGQDSVEGVAA